MNLPHPLHGAALARPDAPALLTGGHAFTHRGLYGAARRWAGAPFAMGVEAGEVVGLSGPATARWVLAWHALGLRGAVVSPLPHGVPEALRAEMAAAAGVTRVFEPDAEAFAGLETQCADDVHVPLNDAAPADWALDAPRVVVCTSGSTGRPRALTLTTGQLVFSAFGSALRLGHLPGDRWLACLPLHAVGGLSILFRATLSATTVDLRPRFVAGEVADALVAGTCALVSLVPSMLADTLDALAGRPISPAVRAVLIGGAPTPPALVERARAAGLPLALTWGMTETASQACTWSPGAFDTAGVGAPQAFARVHADVNGRLHVRGPVAQGGEVATGDAGEIDADGRVHVHGRVDDVLNSGGVKIAPAEIEAALGAHPAVAEVAVVKAAHPRWGERPVAFVRLHSPATPAALRDHCRGRLARHSCPEVIEIVTELPRVSTGKVDRRALASRAADAVLALAEEPA
jgi:O-succinylbenzoic acid--CoA ligase